MTYCLSLSMSASGRLGVTTGVRRGRQRDARGEVHGLARAEECLGRAAEVGVRVALLGRERLEPDGYVVMTEADTGEGHGADAHSCGSCSRARGGSSSTGLG